MRNLIAGLLLSGLLAGMISSVALASDPPPPPPPDYEGVLSLEEE